MGVVDTEKWLDEHFSDPVTICHNFKKDFDDDKPQNIYQYLSSFGMYKPTRRTKLIYEQLKAGKIWGKIDRLFNKYKKRWNGPDIPVYIFPFQASWGEKENKSGVSFPNQLFLFIGDVKDDKELEALFIHEYHHVCRIHAQKKSIEEYTLLDSIIMEGLAELAVRENCGETYNATWCHLYEPEEMKKYWEEKVKEHMNIKKTEKKHDELLYGFARNPSMIGYCIGYYLVTTFHAKRKLSEQQYFTVKSNYFVS